MIDDPRLTTLQDLQRRFCDAVRRGEWSEAGELQDQRFALIDALLGNPNLSTPAMTGALRQIAEVDCAMLPELTAARDDTARQLRELRGARKALDAYTQTP